MFLHIWSTATRRSFLHVRLVEHKKALLNPYSEVFDKSNTTKAVTSHRTPNRFS